jgi:very-short-patch-repair endonuclease
MAPKKLGTESREAWARARRQHGVITRHQLHMLGFSDTAIKHRRTKGRLHPIWRGVYAVGRPELTREGRWMAAVLACGSDAALSHHSAAAFWGFGREWARGIDVSVRRECYLRREGIRARSRPSLPATDVVIHKGIPVTTPARTVVDIATDLIPIRLERAVNDADKLDLIDAEKFGRGLDRFAGEPGVKPLRRLLDPYTFRLSDSDLEILFRPIARAAGLPSPLTKQPVNGFEVDFFWQELGLVVETDGLHYHRTPSEQTRDRLRDQAHTASGLTHLRFTHWQVAHERAHVREMLERTAANLRS